MQRHHHSIRVVSLNTQTHPKKTRTEHWRKQFLERPLWPHRKMTWTKTKHVEFQSWRKSKILRQPNGKNTWLFWDDPSVASTEQTNTTSETWLHPRILQPETVLPDLSPWLNFRLEPAKRWELFAGQRRDRIGNIPNSRCNLTMMSFSLPKSHPQQNRPSRCEKRRDLVPSQNVNSDKPTISLVWYPNKPAGIWSFWGSM